MSFADDLNTDLHNVFFADFNDVGLINGNEVVGFLDINAYRWADIDSNQHIFITPHTTDLTLQRHDSLTISGQLYKYVTKRQNGNVIHLIVTPG